MADSLKPQHSPKRRAPRVPTEGIHLLVDGGPARLVDLSEQGMRFAAARPFAPGDILHAALRAGSEEVRVEGSVKWCTADGADGHSVGVSFRGSNQQALRKGILALFLAAGS